MRPVQGPELFTLGNADLHSCLFIPGTLAEIETQKKGPGVGGTRALVLSSEALLGAQGPKEGSGGYVPFVLLIYAQGFQADKADWGER